MDEASINKYITDAFAGVETSSAFGATFFFFDPAKMFPFATITATDENDGASNLNRPGVFRLNIGVSKQTFQSLFAHGDAEHDFTALDRLMPHPVYGKMYWICVLNPSEATFQSVKSLLAEAYEMAVRKQAKAGEGKKGEDA
jgi:hypothetical protein